MYIANNSLTTAYQLHTHYTNGNVIEKEIGFIMTMGQNGITTVESMSHSKTQALTTDTHF